VVLSLVVFLKMWSGLAIYSLIPLTLMGLLTSWTVILRKQFNDLLFKRELAKAESDQRQHLLQTLAALEHQLREKEQQIVQLQTQVANLQTALDGANSSKIEPSHQQLTAQILDQGRVKATMTKQHKANQRRVKVLAMLQETSTKNAVNFEQWGRDLGTSGQTITNDLRWLVEQGYWNNEGTWQMSEAGQALLEVQRVY
jgi:septal ring factor EnvC (AmiA/AmiB activator)